MIDLGFANDWRFKFDGNPPIYKHCLDSGHTVIDVRDESHLGYVHKVTCSECDYVYRYDSGD